MREMKDSGIPWIGEIPKNWEICPLKYLCSYNNETLPENTNGEYEFDYVDIGSVTYGKGIENYQHLKFSKAPSRARRLVKTGDIILSTVRTYLKATAQIPENVYPIVVSTGYLTLRANKQIIPNFLKYSVQQDAFISEIEAKSSGVSYPAINASEAVRTSVIVPPIEEQQRIADFLDAKCAKIDSVRKNVESEIEALKQYKQSVITEAVTKGLDPDVEMKDSRVEWIGEIPKQWKIIRLKYILKEPMKYGANEAGVAYDNSLPRYIRITDITPEGKLKEYGKLSLNEDIARNYMLKDKALLFARSGATVGKVFFYKKEYGAATFAGYLISAIVDANKALPEWVYYYTNSSAYWEWINQIYTQSTIQNIGADKYSEMPIPICSDLSLQAKILKFLDSKCAEIDSIVEDKQKQISTLDEYKKSLIYEYVTGKKEVPSA